MGLRFRKRVKIAPGITLNFSKSGISTTVGVRGASVNFGKNGTYVNTGIPGTGLYMREKVESKTKNNQLKTKPKNHRNQNINKKNDLSSKTSFRVIRALSGLFILCFSFVLLIAFISHNYTDYFAFTKSDLDNLGILPVHNLFGKFGFVISFYLMNNAFGVGAYLIPILLIIIALRLIGSYRFNLLSHIPKTLILMLIISILVSSLYRLGNHPLSVTLGGYLGDTICKMVEEFFGINSSIPILIACIVSLGVFMFIKNKKTNEQQNTSTKANSPKVVNNDSCQKKLESKTSEAFGSIPTSISDKNNNDLSRTTQDSSFDIAKEFDRVVEETYKTGLKLDSDSQLHNEAEIKETKNEVHTLIKTTTDINLPYDPKLELSGYQYPTLDLLEHYHNDLQDSDIIAQNANKERLIRALSSFDIEVNTIRANVGAVVTLYEITLADGVSIRQLFNIEEDLALTLAVDSVRITPIPSRGTIGIEIPNEKRGIVSIESVLNSKEFIESHMELPCAIGKTLTNDVFMIDLAKAPHILVAGSTGQGKSVFIDTIITSLLYKKHPSELKFVLIDSRKVQLSLYEAIENQYLARLEDSNESIITDASSAISTLDSLCELMENRYKMLRAAKVRNIKEYNEKFRARQLSPLSGFEFLPYYVVIIDEYGDLIYYNKDEFEKSISRLAKLGRATGIHLIISTQRPTVNIVTGEIKENFPTRVAFKVPSSTDSHIILDMPGANQLMGRGDMLYLQNDNPVRVQCAYVDTSEVERICRFINAQQKFPESTFLPNPYIDYDERGTVDVDMHNLDPMFAEVARMVVSKQEGSTSNIQRQFSIGYNRAGKLMDQLERAGVVGPQFGSKPREVLIQDLCSLESLLTSLGK